MSQPLEHPGSEADGATSRLAGANRPSMLPRQATHTPEIAPTLDELIEKSHKLVEHARRLDSDVQELAKAIAANVRRDRHPDAGGDATKG